jgi:HTH-type transcriptional regulator/antitoxin HipB
MSELESSVKYRPRDIGKLVRDTRKSLGVTQRNLALTSGTGLRFVIDLEKGKETCEIGKALTVLQTLGIRVTLTAPASPAREE